LKVLDGNSYVGAIFALVIDDKRGIDHASLDMIDRQASSMQCKFEVYGSRVHIADRSAPM